MIKLGTARTLLVVAGVLVGVGATLVLTQPRYFRGMPLPPPYGQGQGRTFCEELATTAQDRSVQWLVLGALAVLMGVVATGCGAMIGPGVAGDGSVRGRLKENRNALMALGGALALSTGYGIVQRSDAATVLAAGASARLAIAPDDDKAAFQQCVLERATWLVGRADHSWLDSLPGAKPSPSALPTPSNPGGSP